MVINIVLHLFIFLSLSYILKHKFCIANNNDNDVDNNCNTLSFYICMRNGYVIKAKASNFF